MLVSPTKKIGIVVLNYKNYEDTIECLRSLDEITYPNTEIVVVDNDSQNDSVEHIRQSLSGRKVAHALISGNDLDAVEQIPEKTILVRSFINRGYAAGNNVGIRVALARGVDYILILNNDTLVEKNFLEPMVQYAEAHAQVAAVGPKVVDANGRIDPICARRRLTFGDYFFRAGMGRILFPNNRWARRHTYQGEYGFDHPREVDVLLGCCMLIKGSVFQRLGLLDEGTFLYLEEFILHEKFRDVGWISVVVPDSVIVHKHGRSIAKVPSDFVRDATRASLRYYLMRYRHYSRFKVAVVMMLLFSPKMFFRKLWNVLGWKKREERER